MSIEEGDKYQKIAADICRSLGYQVIEPTNKNNSRWDYVVNGKKLQVKKRTVDSFTPNRVRLVTNLSASVEICTTKQVDAFAIYWMEGWYVFPSHVVADYRGVIKNKVLMNRVGHFKNCWSVLNGDWIDYDRQGFLFDL